MVIDVLKLKKMFFSYLRNNLIWYLCFVIFRVDFKIIKIGLVNEELYFWFFYINFEIKIKLEKKCLLNYSYEFGSLVWG